MPLDDLHAALVTDLVLGPLLGEEVPDEPACAGEQEVRKGSRRQVQQLAHLQAPPLAAFFSARCTTWTTRP